MISLVFTFWMFVVLFGIIGLMRGWAKELLVVFSVILALAFNRLLERYVPVVNTLPPDSQALFTNEKTIRKLRLRNFPAFDIIRENARTQQLSALQANALSQFAAFCLMEEGPKIRKHLGL